MIIVLQSADVALATGNVEQNAATPGEFILKATVHPRAIGLGLNKQSYRLPLFYHRQRSEAIAYMRGAVDALLALVNRVPDYRILQP